MSCPFPYSPVIREFSWKKIQIEKKNKKNVGIIIFVGAILKKTKILYSSLFALLQNFQKI